MIKYMPSSAVQDNKYYKTSPDYVMVSNQLYVSSKKYLPAKWVNLLLVKDNKKLIWLHKPILVSDRNREQLATDIDNRDGRLGLMKTYVSVILTIVIALLVVAATLNPWIGFVMLILGGIGAYFHGVSNELRKVISHLLLKELVKLSK